MDIMMKRLAFLLTGFFVVLTLSHASAVPNAGRQQPPTQIVKNFYDKLASVMKDGDKLGFEGREKALTPAIKNSFNFPLMTRVAVGPLWSEATPDEQKKLIAAFSQFSIANYASQLFEV